MVSPLNSARIGPIAEADAMLAAPLTPLSAYSQIPTGVIRGHEIDTPENEVEAICRWCEAVQLVNHRSIRWRHQPTPSRSSGHNTAPLRAVLHGDSMAFEHYMADCAAREDGRQRETEALDREQGRLQALAVVDALQGKFDRLWSAVDYADHDTRLMRVLIWAHRAGNSDAAALVKTLARTYAENTAEIAP